MADHLADEELSIGDYVLSGGELPALVLIDAVARFLPGVLGDPAAPHNDSFSQGSWRRPTTPGRATSGAGPSPTFSCRGTMPPSRRGARRKGSVERRGTARTC